MSCHAFSIRALSPRTAAANAASRPWPAVIKLLTKPWVRTQALAVIPMNLWQFRGQYIEFPTGQVRLRHSPHDSKHVLGPMFPHTWV